jgi:hypothetical protein
MSSSGENEVWTPPRLRARLTAEKGLAPAPRCFIIWRATTRANGAETRGYVLPGGPARQDEPAFEQWLVERHLAGAERLSVSVLVIREQLDATGLLREGVLERRRGGVDGPYHGNVARVEFTGAAKPVRRYRAGPDGRLVDLPPDDATGFAPASTAGEIESFAGEDAAVHDFLVPGSIIVDRRAPSLFEELLGLSAVIHARRPDGVVIGCGVGWHGDVAFVLAADFPRDNGLLVPPPDLEAAVAHALRTRDLIRHETRVDEQGFCVIARERERQGLVTIRLQGKATRIDPYTPDRGTAMNDDQRRWKTYAETYEARTVLDSWRNGDSAELAVLTIDPDLGAWRHIIDTDGVEISRRTDNEAAVAVLYRERHGVTEAAPTAAAGDSAAPGEREAGHMTIEETTALQDDLSIEARAWSDAMTVLEQIRADVADPLVDRHAAAERLNALVPALYQLHVPLSASILRVRIEQLEAGTLGATDLATALDESIACLRQEHALTRVAALSSAALEYDEEAPFGPLVEANFPAAAYDIEEAIRCLALRRSTACVLHAMRVMRLGLARLERVLATPDLTGLPWARLNEVVHGATDDGDLLGTLGLVRRAWRAPGLLPAAKYTEEEAEVVLTAVEAFMRALAKHLDSAERASAG